MGGLILNLLMSFADLIDGFAGWMRFDGNELDECGIIDKQSTMCQVRYLPARCLLVACCHGQLREGIFKPVASLDSFLDLVEGISPRASASGCHSSIPNAMRRQGSYGMVYYSYCS